MATRLVYKYRDYQGREASFSQHVADAYASASDADLLAMIQAHRNMTQAFLVDVKIEVDVDISGLANVAAIQSGSFDSVRDQAILLGKTASGSIVRVTVPAPLDAIFQSSGSYALQDVNKASAEVAAFIAEAITEPVWSHPEDAPVTSLSKGWRRGLPHS